MMKKLISLLLTMILALGLLAPAALAGDFGEDEDYTDPGYYYVYTENGKVLNVRESPRGKVVGALKYGSRIHVDAFVDDNWALIQYNYDNGFGKGDYAAYVNRRFLQKKKPAARNAAGGTAAAGTAAAADSLENLNREFKSAKSVAPYTVTVRPTRTSGWVNLRWAPSQSAELLATFKANDKLTVIKELDNWLQVEVPETGDVGFINKVFIAD